MATYVCYKQVDLLEWWKKLVEIAKMVNFFL